ncbi:dehydrogenase [Pasteurellaceae bacterium 15-036681]|nr:dehydrogenase [Pasteurellaceae bacterium 15-036681]
MSQLSKQFIEWLNQHATQIDQSNQYADELFQRVAQEGIFKIGVPEELGGNGGSFQQAINAVREISTYSLTAGFISWGHRTLIQNLLSSSNPKPRELWLDDLLAGKLSGGTGLSNAVKFLSGIEELQVKIIEKEGERYLQGRLPWITNLTAKGFVTIFAAEYADGSKPAIVVALPSDAEGVTRTNELSLVALQGSNTVAVELNNVKLNPDWIIADNAAEYLAQVRPTFLGLQCPMAFGLAARSLQEVEKSLQYVGNRSILKPEYDLQLQKLADLEKRLADGLQQDDYFVKNPKELFNIRIEVVDVVAQSLLLELQASGGRGYLNNVGSDFIRRWREGAFLPVVTPSALQLKTILQAV